MSQEAVRAARKPRPRNACEEEKERSERPEPTPAEDQLGQVFVVGHRAFWQGVV